MSKNSTPCIPANLLKHFPSTLLSIRSTLQKAVEKFQWWYLSSYFNILSFFTTNQDNSRDIKSLPWGNLTFLVNRSHIHVIEYNTHKRQLRTLFKYELQNQTLTSSVPLAGSYTKYSNTYIKKREFKSLTIRKWSFSTSLFSKKTDATTA